jgi:hypothetical protein
VCWLRDQGAPWDVEHVCKQAAIGGSIDIMAYMLECYSNSMSPALLTDMLAAAGVVNCINHHNVCKQLAAAK